MGVRRGIRNMKMRREGRSKMVIGELPTYPNKFNPRQRLGYNSYHCNQYMLLIADHNIKEELYYSAVLIFQTVTFVQSNIMIVFLGPDSVCTVRVYWVENNLWK